MDKKTKVDFLINTLENLYPNPKAPLFHKDPYTLLVAVLLSAQCTDERVNMVSPKLFLKANNPRKMLSLSERQIYNIVRPCGLAPQKSKAIYNLSRILIKEFNGKVPQNYEDLEKLPGVGHKTASVVMSQGFGYPAFPVDTHIHRLAQRWRLTNGKNVKQTEKDLKRLFPETSWNKLHLQIIYYGREFCTARNCFGLECEICSTCFPTRKKSIKTIKA